MVQNHVCRFPLTRCLIPLITIPSEIEELEARVSPTYVGIEPTTSRS